SRCECSRRGYGTALQVAASRDNTGIVQLLLEHGADVNSVGWTYGTALQTAVSRGNTEIVQLLLKQGA
ncbi:ankyrin repeat-containing domain protein, partial [Gautieria morchelliformis]